MLSGVIIVVVLVCYCCHKNMRKNRPREYSPYWRAEPDVQSLEVFTMDAHAMVKTIYFVCRNLINSLNCSRYLISFFVMLGTLFWCSTMRQNC